MKKIIFTTIEQAKALALDSLGCVYRRAKEVYVITTFGSGTFKVEEWDASSY